MCIQKKFKYYLINDNEPKLYACWTIKVYTIHTFCTLWQFLYVYIDYRFFTSIIVRVCLYNVVGLYSDFRRVCSIQVYFFILHEWNGAEMKCIKE